jgi:gluconolactonase
MISIKRASTFVDGLDHPECVTTGRDGTFYAGGEAGQIYRIAADGSKVEQLASTGGFVLGVAMAPDGRHLHVCDLKQRTIFKLDVRRRTLSPFATRAGGKPIDIPNHLAFLPDGSSFVTDSGGFRQVNGRILKFDSRGNGVVWHEGPFNFANGIAVAPDGGAVYVCCTWLPGVERIDIKPDGSPGRRSVFARFPKSLPDGLAFDARNNLYVSCYAPARIYRVSPGRKVETLIDDWEAHTLSNPTNVCFGGPKFDQLFVANLGRWHITKIDLKVRGHPLACHLRRSEKE